MSQKYLTDVHLFKRVFYWFAQVEERAVSAAPTAARWRHEDEGSRPDRQDCNGQWSVRNAFAGVAQGCEFRLWAGA